MADGSRPVGLYDICEIATALGVHKSVAEKRAAKSKWGNSEVTVRGGKKRLYALADLPDAVRVALLLRNRSARAGVDTELPKCEAHIRAAWEAYNAANELLKSTAKTRAEALCAIDGLCAIGHGLLDARTQVAADMQRRNLRGASAASLARWAKCVDGTPCGDWVALLLPSYAGRTARADIPPPAWDFYIGHWLTRAKPSHESTYRRVQELAALNGWAIPSIVTFRRRVEGTVSEYSIKLHREGPAAAATMLPRGRRDELVFAAGEAVNGDGLKFDKFWVRFADGEVLNTATAWFWQDLRTRKILAWRLGKTENTDLFRLATYDLTGVCAPRYAWMDNTRVAANKTMTAGAAVRHRFKADPQDGIGLLQMCGMEPHFTNPDKETGTPGAKPIERAFGIGGIHSEVATHPRIVALGNANKANAVDEDLLREIIAVEVIRHNQHPLRETQACRGVLSFDDAWAASIAQQPVRVLTQAQRTLFLLTRETVQSDKRTGLILIKGGRWLHGQNGFWDPKLTEHMGRKLVVHYDPENIRAGAYVYTLDGRYLLAAKHEPTGKPFNSTEAGREINKLRQRDLKHMKKIAANDVLRSKKERAAMYAQVPHAPPPADATGRSNIIEGNFQRFPNPAADAARLEHTGTDDADPGGGLCLEMIIARKKKLVDAGLID